MNIQQLKSTIEKLPETYTFRIMANGKPSGEYPVSDVNEISDILSPHKNGDIVVEIRRPNSGGRGTQFVRSYPVTVASPSLGAVDMPAPSTRSIPSLAGIAGDNPLLQLTIARLEQERDKFEHRAERLESDNKRLERENFNLEKELKFKDKDFEIQRHNEESEKLTFTDKLMSIVSENPELANAGLGLLQNLMPNKSGLAALPEGASGIEGLFRTVVSMLDTKGKQDMNIILEAIKHDPQDIGMLAQLLRKNMRAAEEVNANQNYNYSPGS